MKNYLLLFSAIGIAFVFSQCTHKDHDDNNIIPVDTNSLSGTYYGIRHIHNVHTSNDSLGTHVQSTDTSYVDSIFVAQTADSAVMIESHKIGYDASYHSFYTVDVHTSLSAVLPPNTDSIYYETVNQMTDGVNSFRWQTDFTGRKR